MTGKGQLTTAPHRRIGWLFAAHLAWLGLVVALGLWWGWLLLRQATRIEELERASGVATSGESWARVSRMLHWELPVYVALLVGSAALFFWLFWRDMRRTRSIQAFFASVTHELRTPLTSIRLQAESIADSADDSMAERKALVERLLEDTMRLEGQVERTLELARVEGGGRVMIEPIRVRPWIERLVQSWRETYADRAVFTTSAVEDIALEADPAGLQIILRNLLENSLRHARAASVRIEVRVQAAGDGVVILFSDDGQGFAGDPRQLGELFHKGQGSQGAGVGLYLVKMLMSRMGGKVDFRVARPAGAVGFEAAMTFRRAHG